MASQEVASYPHAIGGISEPIWLYEGQLELIRAGVIFAGSGHVEFVWFPSPGFHFKFELEHCVPEDPEAPREQDPATGQDQEIPLLSLFNDDPPTYICFPGQQIRTRTRLRGYNAPSSFSGTLEGDHFFGEDAPIDFMTFYLANGPNLIEDDDVEQPPFSAIGTLEHSG